MTDADGGVVILSYTLSKPPRDFDPDPLREAWQLWRKESAAVAS